MHCPLCLTITYALVLNYGACQYEIFDCTPSSPECQQLKSDFRFTTNEQLHEKPNHKLHSVTKLSTRPLLYEINNFLTNAEAERLIEIARGQKLKQGFTERHDKNQHLRLYDLNNDMRLNVSEFRLTLENNFDVYFAPTDILNLFNYFGVDSSNTGIGAVGQTEFEQSRISDTEILRSYVYTIANKKPWLKGRNSENTWIYVNNNQDDIVANVIDRVAMLVNVPPPIMEKSDIQIIHYNQNGHYNVHFDSSAWSNIPCCHRFNGPRPCRPCRFLTILFYLNDVKQGGETAFPVADLENFSETDFRGSHRLDLNLYCNESRLRVKPEKGKAVLWYNHLGDGTDNNWFGALDNYSLHGSCPVIEGEKWAANFWIKVTEDKMFDLTPLQLMSSHNQNHKHEL